MANSSTDARNSWLEIEAARQRREQIVRAGRISAPADSPSALVSDRASYISEQEILIDGGLTQAGLSLIPRPGFQKEDAAPSTIRNYPPRYHRRIRLCRRYP